MDSLDRGKELQGRARRADPRPVRRAGRWRKACVCALALTWLGGVVAEAAAAAGPVRVELMVSRLSKKPGEIDARAAKLHDQLKAEFRYASLKVVKVVDLELAVDEVGSMQLPTGKKVSVRPLLVDDHGVLLAVEVEGSVQTDLRVKSGHLVVIGTERHEKGKLVISMVPYF
ncbi:MAG: hypothetical protein ACQGVK_09190 [Myxococcota bacterium]